MLGDADSGGIDVEPLRWALAELIHTRAGLYGVKAHLERACGSDPVGGPGLVARLSQAVQEARGAVDRLDAAAGAVMEALHEYGRRAT